MLVFKEGGKPGYPKKTLRAQATLAEGERSHNWAIPAPKKAEYILNFILTTSWLNSSLLGGVFLPPYLNVFIKFISHVAAAP